MHSSQISINYLPREPSLPTSERSNCKTIGKIVHGSLVLSKNTFLDSLNYLAFAGFASAFTHGEVSLEPISGIGPERIFRVLDDSMAPKFDIGDYLVCSSKGDTAENPNGNLVVSRIGRHFIFKRLYIKDGFILLRGDNQQYPPLKIREEDLKEIWKVEGKLTTTYLREHHPLREEMEYLNESISELRYRLQRLTDSVEESGKPQSGQA